MAGIPKVISEMVFKIIIGIMIFGDAILAGVWYYGIGEEMLDMKRFRLGMGFVDSATSFGRALYFLIKGNLNFD